MFITEEIQIGVKYMSFTTNKNTPKDKLISPIMKDCKNLYRQSWKNNGEIGLLTQSWKCKLTYSRIIWQHLF